MSAVQPLREVAFCLESDRLRSDLMMGQHTCHTDQDHCGIPELSTSLGFVDGLDSVEAALPLPMAALPRNERFMFHAAHFSQLHSIPLTASGGSRSDTTPS